MATGYGLDGPGIESRRGEIFRTYPDRSWGKPSILNNGYRLSFPGIRNEVKESVELYVYSPSGSLWFLLGRKFTFIIFNKTSRDI
jgi:hypothetical protein